MERERRQIGDEGVRDFLAGLFEIDGKVLAGWALLGLTVGVAGTILVNNHVPEVVQRLGLVAVWMLCPLAQVWGTLHFTENGD